MRETGLKLDQEVQIAGVDVELVRENGAERAKSAHPVSRAGAGDGLIAQKRRHRHAAMLPPGDSGHGAGGRRRKPVDAIRDALDNAALVKAVPVVVTGTMRPSEATRPVLPLSGGQDSGLPEQLLSLPDHAGEFAHDAAVKRRRVELADPCVGGVGDPADDGACCSGPDAHVFRERYC